MPTVAGETELFDPLVAGVVPLEDAAARQKGGVSVGIVVKVSDGVGGASVVASRIYRCAGLAVEDAHPTDDFGESVAVDVKDERRAARGHAGRPVHFVFLLFGIPLIGDGFVAGIDGDKFHEPVAVEIGGGGVVVP